MNQSRIVDLYNRWKDKQLSPAERQEFIDLMQQDDAEQILKEHWDECWSDLHEDGYPPIANERLEQIYEHVISTPPQTRSRLLLRWSVAASILLAVGVLFGYHIIQKKDTRQREEYVAQDILPGGNKATLTLADGRVITLRTDKNGLIVNDMLSYSDGSSDERFSTATITTRQHLTLNTPTGGNYQVTLRDGTKVWLNANSSLTYPASFAGQSHRKVILKGEAYFEVAPDKAHPFVVSTDDQDVQVLGTHFNVSAFPDVKETRTTLVEGLVEVRPKNGTTVAATKIYPNEQFVLGQGRQYKQVVEVDKFIDWKDGYFLFRDDSIKEVMRKVANWYALEVSYTGDTSKERFNGMISKDKPLSEVLKMLEQTGTVQFKIQDQSLHIRMK